MVDIKRGWKNVSDRGKWTARGATVVAKVKATKVVWFPPRPGNAGKAAASTTGKATKKGTKRPTRMAKQAINDRKTAPKSRGRNKA